MARKHTRIVSVKVDETVYEALVQLAHRMGVYTKEGTPNVSEVMRVLIGLGLDNGDGQELAMTLRENARAEIMRKVRGIVFDALNTVNEKL